MPHAYKPHHSTTRLTRWKMNFDRPIRPNKWPAYLGCCIAGSLSTAGAWHPSFWPVSLVGLVALLYLANRAQQQRSPLYGLGFSWGIGFYSISYYWISTPIHTFTHLPLIGIYLLTTLMVFYCAQLPALMMLASQYLSRWLIWCPTFVLCWGLGEWLVSQFSLSFPWTLLGYLMIKAPWASLAPYGGIYAVSMMTLLIAAILMTMAHRPARPLAIGLLVALLASCGLLQRLAPWTHPAGHLSVNWVETHRSAQQKWSRHRFNSLNTLLKLSAAKPHADLMVWPEGALPWVYEQHPRKIQKLNQWLRKHDTQLIAGIFHQNGTKIYNSALVQGHQRQWINKHQLVPFGEYIPLQSLLLPLLRSWQIPMSHLTPGQGSVNVPIQDAIMAIMICYEIAFPTWVWQHSITNQALITITDDNWFNSPLAIQEHLNILTMRVLETQKPGVFVNDSGRSQLIPISHHLQLQQNKQQLELRSGATPIVIWGPWPMFMVLMTLLILLSCTQPKQTSATPATPLH